MTTDSGTGSYFGQPPVNPGYNPNEELRQAFDYRRNRDVSDHQVNANFDSDLSLKHDYLRSRMTPEALGIPQNVVYNPPASEEGISPLDKAKLGLEGKRIDQTGKLADAELGLKDREFKLDKLKNDQIYGPKTADMERKTNEANQRLQLAYDQLQARQGDSAATSEYHRAQIDAANARHALEMTQKEADLTESKRLHDAQIKDIHDKAAQAGVTIETTGISDDGNIKTTVTRKGERPVKQGTKPGTIRVIETATGKHGDLKDPGNKPLPSGYTAIGVD